MFALQQLSDIAPYTMTNTYYGWQSVCRQGGKFDDGNRYSSAGNSLNFPIAFPNACETVTSTRIFAADSSHAAIIHVVSYSKASATFAGGINDSGGGWNYGTSGNYNWLAIGY